MKGDSLDRIFAQNLAMIDTRLTPMAANVFGRLLFHRNSRNGLCFPGLEVIAFDLNCSTRTVRSALRLLESTGYIKTERRWRGTRSNRYDLFIPSGRMAYDQAEEERLNYRNGSSRQQRKENNNEQRGRSPGNTGRVRPTNRPRPNERQNAKNIGALHAKVLETSGGGDVGWEIAMGIEDGAREAIECAYQSGALDLAQAVSDWVDRLAD